MKKADIQESTLLLYHRNELEAQHFKYLRQNFQILTVLLWSTCQLAFKLLHIHLFQTQKGHSYVPGVLQFEFRLGGLQQTHKGF
jgi:hypothetical protein